MTNTQSKTANVLGAKTARACDSCLRKRARWFCAADDAFLCQNCDTSVHSANQLASRHERVRLETASCKIKLDHMIKTSSWHQGFTKKPRTPRSARRLHHHNNNNKDDDQGRKTRDWNRGFLVPEISGGDEDLASIDENEEREQLPYRVPVLDPFATDQLQNHEMDDIIVKDSEFDDLDVFFNDHDDASRMNDIPGFTSSDIELEKLALDSLLGTEIEEDSRVVVEGLCGIQSCVDDKRFKIETENMDCRYDLGLDTASESFNWEFDYSMSPICGEDEEIRINGTLDLATRDMEMNGKEKRRIHLKLNYDGVISAWDCQSSPWIDGIKPQDFSLDDCCPDFMESGRRIDENGNGVNVGRCWDGEREAKVLRYREKRRKRLFAKKIRYHVRKLNAEKRPRMKGRFVKRTSFA